MVLLVALVTMTVLVPAQEVAVAVVALMALVTMTMLVQQGMWQ